MSVDSDIPTVCVPLLGITVNPASANAIADKIISHIRTKDPIWIGNHNLHSAYLWNSDRGFRQDYEQADVWIIDGWPIFELARRSARKTHGLELSRADRVGSTDWLQELLLRGEPLSIVSLGGTAESASEAARRVYDEYPWIEWRGFDGFEHGNRDNHAPRLSLDEALSRADLVLVGMGMPIQERWIADNYSRLRKTVVANTGGCVDYLAGKQALAPRWMGGYGLEWLYRLVKSPSRLAYRYLVEPLLLAQIIIQKGVTRR